MTAKATIKASELIKAAKEEKGEKLTKSEIVRVAAPSYIPPVLMGAATITCIFGANILNKRHQAALVSAYALLDQRYKNYKKKVIEIYGDDANEEIADSIARDKYQEQVVDDGKELFFDLYSERYFESTMEDVKQAEYDINKIMVTDCGASLNEFYELLGLPNREEYAELGWSTPMMEETYWHPWIEFNHRKMLTGDGNECYIIEMPFEPFVDYLDW